jgi:GDPmannose 4,6-dehydratase
LEIDLVWKGKGVDEVGLDKKTGKVIIKIHPKYFRPAEVDVLLGNPKKAEEKLGWRAKTKFEDLVKLMVKSDYELIKSGGKILY